MTRAAKEGQRKIGMQAPAADHPFRDPVIRAVFLFFFWANYLVYLLYLFFSSKLPRWRKDGEMHGRR